MMDPYSIYYRHRPTRIAYLVNPEGSLWIDRIIKFSRKKWGGRFDPMILTDGKRLDSNWWDFLKSYDPDIIMSTVGLEEELRKQIHVFLSPLTVESIRPDDIYVRLGDDPLSIFPTQKNIEKVIARFPGDEVTLISFEPTDNCPTVIREFLDRNFGLYEPEGRRTFQLASALKNSRMKRLQVSDFATLSAALLEVSSYYRYVFPGQICSIPNTLKDVEFNQDDQKFAVVLGDTTEDIVYSWNRTINTRSWMRPRIATLWLPTEIEKNQELRPALMKFINCYAEQIGTTYHWVHFVSLSRGENEVQAVRESFQKGLQHLSSSARLDCYRGPVFRESLGIYSRKSLELHRAHSNEEYLVLDQSKLDIPQFSGGQSWFTDLYIQYRPERFTNIHGVDYWWELPRRTGLPRELRLFNKPARVNELRSFSVLLQHGYESNIGPKEEPLVIRIPVDSVIFSALFCGRRFDDWKGDQQGKYEPRPFHTMQRSDKGMYLTGVLSLFPDLTNAYLTFGDRFWRRLFERMSNQSEQKDKAKVDEITNKIKKNLRRGRDFTHSEDGIKWLAEYVLSISRDYSKEGIDLSFRQLVGAAKEENDEYNRNNPDNVFPFSEEDLLESVSGFVEAGILLLGLRPKCPRCGYRIWYHLDEIKQSVTCKGCGHHFAMPSEMHWYYRLNNLVRAAVSLHGTVPVLLTLGQLFSEARSSFIFVTCQDLFIKKESKIEYWGDVDIVCIRDGRFIIGETKKSRGLYEEADFTKMTLLAKAVRPDEVIFSSMDSQPTSFIEQKIDQMRKDLSNLEIDVRWYSLGQSMLEARP